MVGWLLEYVGLVLDGEILSSNLMSECNNVSATDESLASIDVEDEEADLLLNFLSSLREQTKNQSAKLVADIQCLEADIKEVEKRRVSRVESFSNAKNVLGSPVDDSNMHPHKVQFQMGATTASSGRTLNEEKLMKNIDQLEHAYFSMRSSVELSDPNAARRSDVDILKVRDNVCQLQDEAGTVEKPRDCIGTFFEGLCKYARHSKFEVRGTLRNGDILNSANVICSLSFDRDENYFAAAGVSRKIKIFEFGALLNETVDVHYPLIEMSSRSKLSCVSWNNYIKNYLASTDYDGVVQSKKCQPFNMRHGNWFRYP
ncbi:hypothetical protein HPP92_025823 [Vanilla planifolia]|uniref:Uncharacterized protein n=1 Tax=Vanilla planifolia TaxID=51239 RepID=A0A835U8D0_VANPL|nr:hypothetical protein HPP92_025823 [Vanilla planifolia]